MRTQSLVIDEQAVVNALGKPAELKTFGDYAIHFKVTRTGPH